MERANSNDLKLEEKDFLNLLTGSECFQDSGSNDFINILGFSRLSAINLPKAIELRPLPLATCEDPLKSAPKATKRADGCKKSPPHMTKPENMKCDAGVALLVSKPPYAALKPQRMSMLTRSLAQLRRTESAELAIQDKSLNLADKASVGAGSTQPGILSRRRRFNSTSTLHIDSAAAEENLVKTLECLALIISRLVDQNPQDSESRNLVLSEAHHPISLKYQLNKKPLTSLQVFEFLNILFKTAELSVECAVIGLVYIERLFERTGLELNVDNWLRVVLGGVLLASKVWDDQAVWNVDFWEIFPESKIEDISPVTNAVYRASYKLSNLLERMAGTSQPQVLVRKCS